MDQGPHEDGGEAALRPLRTIGGVVQALREGTLPEEDARSAVIQVASAVEMSLRRILRDHPAIAIPVRLRALAPDELGGDEVLAELRQHDRISMELAASVHDLLEVRKRLKAGSPLAPNDAALAHRVAERLELEALAGAVGMPVETPTVADPVSAVDLPVEDATVVLTPARGARKWWGWAAAGVVLVLLLIPLAIWLTGRNADAEMRRGVALFESGAYADAASHFYRHAQANPEDPTPHLYLARIHRRLNRYDLAVPEIRAAMQLAPEDPAVHTELGLLLTDTRRYDVAVARFREAIRLDPEMESAWVGLVRALRAAGRASAADAVLAQAPAEVRAMLSRPGADSATDAAPPL